MINQKNDLNMITRKLETELLTFHFDDLEISEITTKTSWMKLHINVLFIKDNVQITKVLYKDYETGLWYYIKNDGMIISHKDTFNHTIKNLVDEMIYDCHIEIEEAEETETTEEPTEESDKTDYDTLDEKHQTYLSVYRDLQQTLSHLRNCKTVNTYSTCYNRFVKKLKVMRGKSKITNAMYKYIEAKLSMQNVESDIWSSSWEVSMGSHESRRYNKTRA